MPPAYFLNAPTSAPTHGHKEPPHDWRRGVVTPPYKILSEVGRRARWAAAGRGVRLAGGRVKKMTRNGEGSIAKINNNFPVMR